VCALLKTCNQLLVMRGQGHKIRSSLLASLGSWGALFASRSGPPLSRGPHHDPGAPLIIQVRLIIRVSRMGRILLANLLQSSRSTVFQGSFLSFFAFN
jgi:hypothetical protein